MMPRRFVKLTELLNDFLFKNSLFLILSRILNMASGFLFWVIAAKIYSIEAVGTATALLSSLGLIMLFSRLGFDFSLIRYIAHHGQNKVFNTCLSITTVSTFVICLFFLLLDFFLPLQLIPNLVSAVLFVVVGLFNSVTLLTGNMFWAIRNAQHYFMQNLIMSLRLLLLFPFVRFQSFGIFLAMGICYFLASVFALVVLKQKNITINFLAINRQFIRESFKFSLGNFLSNNLYEAPGLVLPIMVLHLLGEGQAAKYYMAFMFGNLAIIIPGALSTSLFIEGSHDRPLRQNVIKSGIAAYLSLVPCVAAIFLFGENILGFINKDYVDAFNLLKLVVISSFFEVVLLLYTSVQNVRMKVEANVKINLLRFLLLLGLSYAFIPKLNLNGIGYALLLTYGVLVCMITIRVIQESVFKNKAQRTG